MGVRLLPGQRAAPVPQIENTSAAVGGCAKVTHFLVGLILCEEVEWVVVVLCPLMKSTVQSQ